MSSQGHRKMNLSKLKKSFNYSRRPQIRTVWFFGHFEFVNDSNFWAFFKIQYFCVFYWWINEKQPFPYLLFIPKLYIYPKKTTHERLWISIFSSYIQFWHFEKTIEFKYYFRRQTKLFEKCRFEYVRDSNVWTFEFPNDHCNFIPYSKYMDVKSSFNRWRVEQTNDSGLFSPWNLIESTSKIEKESAGSIDFKILWEKW